MKLTYYSAKFQNGKFIGSPVTICYRGTTNTLAAKYSPEQINVMVALEMVYRDMQRVFNGRDIYPYILQIDCKTKAEYDFVFDEITVVERLFFGMPVCKFLGSADEEDQPGDWYSYSIPYGQDDEIKILVRWNLPDVEQQTRINETKKIAAQAYA